MSQNLAQLCALLIEDTYGPLYSHIFSTLTTHGRLSARDISQKCHLHLRQVIAGLAILVQCLFVYHHTGADGRTSYQANLTTAFNLVRVGRFTQLIRDKFGRDGVDILNHLLVFGYDTGANLQKVPASTKEQRRPNGFDLEYAVTLDDLESDRLSSIRRLLGRLLEQEYIIELRPAHFQTWSDTWRTAEMVVKASGNLSSAKGKKGQEEFEGAVQAEMEKILNGQNPSGDTNMNGKRAAADESGTPTQKKHKRANGVFTDRADVSSTAKSACFNVHSMFRLNHTKLLLVVKHHMMAYRLRQRMGLQPGQVLAALLHQCETRPLTQGDFQQSTSSERPRTEACSAPINMNRLLQDVNIEGDIRVAGYRRHSQHIRLANGYVNGDLSHMDGINMEELEGHVATLAEGSCDFISQKEESGDWNIDVNDAEDRLRDDEIMQTVKQRFGLMSLRIVRILISRGKVDEKALQETGLLNAKDLRRCLAQLNAHGFIDLQEVPREPQRQPARTIYLWFYDAERVRKRVLEDLYKSMCRLLQRLKVERQKVNSTLQKAERSDVKGKEHEILRSDEIAVLKGWRRKELWFLSELERLGSSVDILYCA